MKAMRKILGILVMIAGVLGLTISLAGLVGIWMVKPSVVGYISSIIDTLNSNITTSYDTLEITSQALGATVDSVDALSVLLSSTATSVEATTPMIESVNTMLGKNLPDTFNSATESLKSAQQSAAVLDSSIQSLIAFQLMMSDVPLLSAFVQQPAQAYNPEKPLADSLGELASELEALPEMFVTMAESIDKADDNLETIHSSLITMSASATTISQSLSDYEMMVTQSQTSVESLTPMLTGIQDNLQKVVDGAVWALSLFFLWLLAIQVVVFSQGWELYQGTAGRMEGGEPELAVTQPADQTSG
jgi:methyl-accepting chemotaxis protein